MQEEWKVYYNGNFGNRHRGRFRPGKEIKLGKWAFWKDEKVCIPSVYSCSQGLIIDFIIEVNLERVKEFVKKYDDLQWEQLSGEEREKIELESPMELDFTANLTLNGRKLQADRACGVSWIPKELLKEEQASCLESEQILKHYGMDLSKAYLIWRRFYLWATKRKPKIKTLEMELVPSPRSVPGIHFKAEEPGQKVRFAHPVTGTEHTIIIRDWGWQQIPMGEKESQWVYPDHCAVLEYQIDPWISPEQAAVLDSKEGDRPYLKNKDPKASISLGASSVAVIGGGAGRCRGKDQIRYASSSLYFKPQKEIEWRVLFRILDREKLKIVLYCNSSAMHLLARAWRTRSVWRPPYKDSDRKNLMKTSFQHFFLSESSHD